MEPGITPLQLFNTIRNNVGENGSQMIIDYVDQQIALRNQEANKEYVVKSDFQLLRDDIHRLELMQEKRFSAKEVSDEKRFSALETKIAESRNSLLIWLFTTMLAGIGLTVTLLKLF